MNADRNTAIALAAVLTAWFFGSLIAAKGLFSQETAAWVQAIGAVAAIAATGYYASLPGRLEERRRRQEANGRLAATTFAFRATWIIANPIAEALDRNEYGSAVSLMKAAETTPVFSAADAYLKLTPDQWPSARLFIFGSNLRNTITSLVAAQHRLDEPEYLTELTGAYRAACAAFAKEAALLKK